MNTNDRFDSDDEDNVYRNLDQNREHRKQSQRSDFEEEAPPKKGWGCFVWTLIILSSICLLCCCGFSLTLYSLSPKIMDKPADVELVKDQLIEGTFPPGLSPKLAGHWGPFGMGQVSGVVYIDEKEQKFLGIIRINGFTPQLKQVIEQFKREIIKQNAAGKQDDNSTVISSETKMIKLNSGQEVEFQFIVLENNVDKKKFHQVLGTLPSPAGEVAIIYIVPDDKWDEEQTIDFLKTLNAKD